MDGDGWMGGREREEETGTILNEHTTAGFKFRGSLISDITLVDKLREDAA
jgi:hypothetical protein